MFSTNYLVVGAVIVVMFILPALVKKLRQKPATPVRSTTNVIVDAIERRTGAKSNLYWIFAQFNRHGLNHKALADVEKVQWLPLPSDAFSSPARLLKLISGRALLSEYNLNINSRGAEFPEHWKDVPERKLLAGRCTCINGVFFDTGELYWGKLDYPSPDDQEERWRWRPLGLRTVVESPESFVVATVNT